jgi:hypothetical protein
VTIQPVSQPISPLWQRMLEDMAMRGLRAETQRDYVRFVQSFAAFLRRPPDTATPSGHFYLCVGAIVSTLLDPSDYFNA